MKTFNFETREEWLAARRGKITGSRLKDLITKRGTGRKIGFYELIAEKLGIPADDDSAMDRGARLETEAIEQFVKETGKKVDTSLVIWTRDDDENIAISPDGFIGQAVAVEAKCLSSARHIEAWVTKEIPSEYQDQALQYFVVNDKLKTLHFVFYDPRLIAKPYFTLEMKREDVKEKVEEYLTIEKQMIVDVNEIVNQLTF